MFAIARRARTATRSSTASPRAKRPDTRERRIEEYVAMLARGETPYPQKRKLQEC